MKRRRQPDEAREEDEEHRRDPAVPNQRPHAGMTRELARCDDENGRPGAALSLDRDEHLGTIARAGDKSCHAPTGHTFLEDVTGAERQRAASHAAPVDPDGPDERPLVDGLRRGDAAAFDRTYAAYHRRIHSFLLRLSGRADTAEDLAQETWLKLAKAAPTLREDTRLGPLLFTIARNAFVSHRRWAMLDLSRIVTIGLDTISAISSEPLPDEEHERARSIALLEKALAELPVASREVLLLVGVEGLEQEEVARILGVSYDALRQRLSRARGQLAAKMQKLEERSAREKAPAALRAKREREEEQT